MGKYRSMNASLAPDPVYPKPSGVPVIDETNCDELDGSVYLTWDYTSPDADTLTGYWVRISKEEQPTTVLLERWVAEPLNDLIVENLVNDHNYLARVTAQNPGGEGPMSSPFMFTPRKPVVPTPTLKTCTGSDGKALATWTWSPDLPEGFKYDWISYEAVNEVGATVAEHVTGGEWPAESGALPLANDHDWKVAIVAIASNTNTNRQYISDLSNTITVHTEKPLPPYAPKMLAAQIDSGNVGYVEIAFTPGDENITATRPRRWWHKALKSQGRTGPGDITGWQVKVTDTDRAGYFVTYDIEDPSARTYRTTNRVALGGHMVSIRAKNPVGWGLYSNEIYVEFKTKDTRPFTADKPFTLWSSLNWNYAIFDPGNDPSKGWDYTWQCTLTDYGKTVPMEFCVVSAGGGGKGTTATLGKGGNGGGGQVVYDAITATNTSSMTIFASIGGSTGIDPKSSVVTIGGKAIGSTAGKSASSAQDAQGYPKTLVDSSWLDCRSAFDWLTPDSNYIGGIAETGKQGYPNGLGWGQAGAGSKTQNGGRGVQGIIVIRWPK